MRSPQNRYARSAIAITLVFCVTSSTYGDFISYFRFLQLSVAQQRGYIAGAFDAYVGYARPSDIPFAVKDCVMRLDLSDADLTVGLLAFEASHPERQPLPLSAALVQYLVALCGL